MEQSPSTKPLLVAAVNCMMLLLRGKYREIVSSVVRLDSVFCDEPLLGSSTYDHISFRRRNDGQVFPSQQSACNPSCP